jgi:hypothetical protein
MKVTSRTKKKEVRPTSPLVVPMETAPTLRYPLMQDCNLLSDPRVVL